MGVLGGFRGSKNQKSGKCHELPRIFFFYINPVEGGGCVVGWGGSFRGPKIKSPGNVMNGPKNQ